MDQNSRVVGKIAVVIVFAVLAFLFTQSNQSDKDNNNTESNTESNTLGLETQSENGTSEDLVLEEDILDNNLNNQEVTTMAEENKVGRHDILPETEIAKKKSVLTTDKGVIEFELFDYAPLAASNHIGLVEEGFYDGLTFHRREEGFVIQGGDPNGTGTGGPGYQFEDEFIPDNIYPRTDSAYGEIITYEKGIVAMANAGPNTNGSQFFIMLEDVSLPPSYTIFGKVTKGLDVVEKIQVGDKMTKVEIMNK